MFSCNIQDTLQPYCDMINVMSITIEINEIDCYLLASALRIGAKSWRQIADNSSENKEMMLERASKIDEWANRLTLEANSKNIYKQNPKKKKQS